MITLLPPHPAALVKTKKTRTLVIADLHIGWELALSQKGIHVPTQTPKLLQRLTSLLSDCKPQKLLVLGDVKHTVATAEIGEWRDVPDFFSQIRRYVDEICIVRGNHDGNLEPLLPQDPKISLAANAVCDGIGFFHGHQWPSLEMLNCKTLVMGHVHPVISFRDPSGFRIIKQVWVRAACDKAKLARVLLERQNGKSGSERAMREQRCVKPKTEQLFIMPSFNDFLGGKPLNEKRLTQGEKSETIVGPVLRSGAVDLQNSEIYLLDGTFLGTLRQLEFSY
ncbi:MAG: metallophosphoesterase [Candidatus Bathyarchaeia archaeon]